MERSKQAPDEGLEREVFDFSLKPKHHPHADASFPNKVYPTLGKPKQSTKHQNSNPKPHAGDRQTVQTFILRVTIALALCICFGWTLWLILLNVAPNDTVNGVMNTNKFDYGSFWLMVKPSKAMVGVATFGLSVVALGYLSLLVKMLTCIRWPTNTCLLRHVTTKALAHKLGKALTDTADRRLSSRVTSSTMQLAILLTHEESSAHKRIKLLMKFGDLALETLLLYQMLEAGSPAVLIGIFTFVTASNALACAAIMFVPHERAPLAEIFVDILSVFSKPLNWTCLMLDLIVCLIGVFFRFDFLIIIGCPMLVVIYCLSTFTFDHVKFAINLKVFPPGWFEQGASVIADAEQIAVIYESLKSLRIMTALNFFTRIGVNMTLCFRLWLVMGLIHNPKKHRSSVYPKRHRFGAALLVVYAATLAICVEESVRISSLACQPHPECVVNARRWTILEDGSLTQCPCLMLIDRDLAPKTYAEWEKPINVTKKVAQLAAKGDLQTVQLTNRYLAVLPEELRLCKNLRHLSLEYTHTQTFPAWIGEFTKLEFLHVESKHTSPMAVLPDDMFDDMSALTFIHLALFIPMAKLPSFDGLTNLKSLTLAVFLLLEELPAFDKLHNLERIVLASMPAINTLPDFAPIKDLKSFAASDRGAWCCNGFLGDCDLSDGKCGVHPMWGTPAATCVASDRTETIATPATLAAVKRFSATTCGPVLRPGDLVGPPTPELMAPCNGTMWKQCEWPGGVEAICYSTRFMAIACTTSAYPIEMRRQQIARGVGDRCDPAIEAWLGCKAS